MHRSVLLIALDSVGIDPLGHDRPGSIYRDSEFLFPRGERGPVIPVLRETPRGACRGVLVETDVTGNETHRSETRGAIECAITYTSLFSGRDTIARHGLMQGLGMNDALLESLVRVRSAHRIYGRAVTSEESGRRSQETGAHNLVDPDS